MIAPYASCRPENYTASVKFLPRVLSTLGVAEIWVGGMSDNNHGSYSVSPMPQGGNLCVDSVTATVETCVNANDNRAKLAGNAGRRGIICVAQFPLERLSLNGRVLSRVKSMAGSTCQTSLIAYRDNNSMGSGLAYRFVNFGGGFLEERWGALERAESPIVCTLVLDIHQNRQDITNVRQC